MTLCEPITLCHWHDAIEFIQIVEGGLYCHINGDSILLNQHDGLLINANHLHYATPLSTESCTYRYILLDSALLLDNRFLCNHDIIAKWNTSSPAYLSFDGIKDNNLLNTISRIIYLKSQNNLDYASKILYELRTFLIQLYQKKETMHPVSLKEIDTNLKIMQNMISFIYTHYSERLSLSRIALSGNVSQSKCCHLFRTFLKQTPIEFLNKYRLKMSIHMLLHTQTNITNIALDCGFNHLSYFSELFYRYYQCTPRDYRKTNGV